MSQIVGLEVRIFFLTVPSLVDIDIDMVRMDQGQLYQSQ